MEGRYSELVANLHARGLQPYMMDRVALMIASRCPALPGEGNCFVILRLDDDWFIRSMGGWYYRVADKISLHELCIALFTISGFTTLMDIPEPLQNQYKLSRLNPSEVDHLHPRIFEAESLAPPPDNIDRFTSEMTNRGFQVFRSPSAESCVVIGPVTGSRLWFSLFRNHWYIRTISGALYTCYDEHIIGFCFYALREEPPVHDRFSVGFINGYGVRELSEDRRPPVLALADFDSIPS